jgi:hypothetical protein
MFLYSAISPSKQTQSAGVYIQMYTESVPAEDQTWIADEPTRSSDH